MQIDILNAFSAHKGLVAVVGAGGKKSTIHRLAVAHSGKIGITSTVYTPPFRHRLNAYQVVSEPNQLYTRVEHAAQSHQRIAYAHISEKAARLGGVPPDDVSKIHRDFGFDATFIKADGARLRWLKAPGEQEPVLPSDTAVLIPVLSIRAIGMPLTDDVAHRAEDVAKIMNIRLGDRITAVHLARLFSSEKGGMKASDGAQVIPLLNMIENKQDLHLGRLVAEQTLDQSDRIDRVVIASMVREHPILQVIEK